MQLIPIGSIINIYTNVGQTSAGSAKPSNRLRRRLTHSLDILYVIFTCVWRCGLLSECLLSVGVDYAHGGSPAALERACVVYPRFVYTFARFACIYRVPDGELTVSTNSFEVKTRTDVQCWSLVLLRRYIAKLLHQHLPPPPPRRRPYV